MNLKNFNAPYFLGIDAGGTKTHFKLCDKAFNIIKEIQLGACNCFDNSMMNAQNVLKKGIEEICEGISCSDVYMFAGIAGGGTESVRKEYHKFFEQFNFMSFDNDSDIKNVIYAGLNGKDGITVIMGTGICLYKVINNVYTKISGWGYLFDEAGSAFNIGQDAFKAYFAAHDGYGEKTALTEAIEKKIGQPKEEILPLLYSGGKKYIASFAQLVFDCANNKNDSVSKNIIKRNISFVAGLIDTALEEFENTEKPVNIIISGGLTNQPDLTHKLSREIKSTKKMEIRVLDTPPVDGALRKAKLLYEERVLVNA